MRDASASTRKRPAQPDPWPGDPHGPGDPENKRPHSLETHRGPETQRTSGLETPRDPETQRTSSPAASLFRRLLREGTPPGDRVTFPLVSIKLVRPPPHLPVTPVCWGPCCATYIPVYGHKERMPLDLLHSVDASTCPKDKAEMSIRTNPYFRYL